MCKFCEFKYHSNLDSFAFGETIDSFCIVKNIDNLQQKHELFIDKKNEDFNLKIEFCPLCGSYLYHTSYERIKEDDE